jgi:hypothetical protein
MTPEKNPARQLFYSSGANIKITLLKKLTPEKLIAKPDKLTIRLIS